MNRVQIIHKNLGVKMWVTETEAEKYLAAGHKLAASSEKPAEKKVKVEVEEPKAEEEPKKKTSKKK